MLDSVGSRWTALGPVVCGLKAPSSSSSTPRAAHAAGDQCALHLLAPFHVAAEVLQRAYATFSHHLMIPRWVCGAVYAVRSAHTGVVCKGVSDVPFFIPRLTD